MQQILERVNRMFRPGTILIVAQQLKYPDLEAIQDQMDQMVGLAPRFGVGETEISYQGLEQTAAVYGHTNRANLSGTETSPRAGFLGLARITLDFVGSVLSTGRFAEGTATTMRQSLTATVGHWQHF